MEDLVRHVLSCDERSSFTVDWPSGSTFLVSFASIFGTNIILAAIGALLFTMKRRKQTHQQFFLLVALLLALFPLCLFHVVKEGLGEERVLYQLGFFFSGTMFSLSVFRTIEVALDTTPQGAKISMQEFILYFTASIDPQYKLSKEGDSAPPVALQPGALGAALLTIILRLTTLMVVCSVHSAHSGRPFAVLVASASTVPAVLFGSWCLDNVFQTTTIWLFLALFLDISSVMLILQQRAPIVGFRNPVFASTSPREFWGKRWNLQINSNLKRAVFLPMLTYGAPKVLASVATFVASAAFHEYQFVLAMGLVDKG